MNKDIEIQAVMTKTPHSIGLDQDIDLAIKMLRENNFHHLPVQHGGRLVGIVSDRDIKFANGWNQNSEQKLVVEDVYAPEPYIVTPTTKLTEVLRSMVANQIGCVIVAQHGDKLVGIFTNTDACRYFADFLESEIIAS